MSNFLNSISSIYIFYLTVKKFILKNYLTLSSLLIFIIIFSLLFIIYYFNPYKINNHLPITIIIFFLFIIFFILSFSIIGFEQLQFSNLVLSNSYLFFYIFFIYFGIFLLFLLFFNISKKIILTSNIKSGLSSIILIILTLAIIYNVFIKHLDIQKDNYTFIQLLKDILFYIPCLLSDSIELITNQAKNTPKTTYILTYILIFYISIVYLIPIIINYNKNKKQIILLKEPKPLNDTIVLVKQDELKNKIIESKPFLQKMIIKNTEELKDAQKYYKNIQSSTLTDKYNQYKYKKVFSSESGPTSSELIEDYCKRKYPQSIVECKDNKINCVDSDNKNYPVEDIHGMYVNCDKDAFSDLFKSAEESNHFYKDTDKIDKISFYNYCKDICDNPTSISCINKNSNSDISNHIFGFNDISNISPDVSYVYSCNYVNIDFKDDDDDTLNEKYEIISGYNDICNQKLHFKCNEGFSNIEGYRDEYHSLDNKDTKLLEIAMLDENEKNILYNTIKQDEQAELIFKKISNSDDMKIFLNNYLNKYGFYSSLMNNLNKFNNNSKTFIHQEVSNLIKYVNRVNKVYDYNYHYSISFWLYLDSSLLKQKYGKGFIMKYADNPTIFYNYETSEIIITISECEKNNNEYVCNDKIIYKTNEILFQKWNNFIINYNYGTLDIFINSNLVLTQPNISPYINKMKNKIQFGDKNEKLLNSGVCKIEYYEKPLNLNNIKNIYKNKDNPCN